MEITNYLFLAQDLGSIPPQDVNIGIKVTTMGILGVFIALAVLFIILRTLDYFTNKLKNDKLNNNNSSTNADIMQNHVVVEPAASVKLQLTRTPTLEEVAVIAAALYIQNIELEAERRYIRSYKRRKNTLHAWKEVNRFQLTRRHR